MNATPTVTARRILKVFIEYAFRHPYVLAGLSSCIILSSALESIVPLFYKKFFDVVGGGTAISDALGQTAFSALIVAFSLKSIGWLSWRGAIRLINPFEVRVMARLTEDAFARLIRHSYGFFNNSFVGSLVRKLVRFVAAFETIFDQFALTLLPLFVSTVGILIVVFLRSWVIGAAILTWMLLFLYANYLAIRWKQRYEIERSAADSRLGGGLSDALTNSITLKLFSGFRHEEKLFGETVEEVRRTRLFSWNINEVIRATQGILTILIEVVVMLGALHLYREGSLTVGDFVLFQTYIVILAQHVWGFGWVLKNVYQAFADSKEMVEIMDAPYEVQDVPGATTLTVSQGEIEFRDIEFSFNEARRVFQNLSLQIQPGEKVAFVGSSGAGKSTIVKLLFRFFDLAGGAIYIDRHDISKVTQESLRDAIALVPQEPILFHRALKENIRYGKRDATDEEVIEAAKKAHCHEFITSLPEGYDTLVGERGVKLSGGERQRVAIARAILKDAPILVLDEATSSLDSESEHLIQDALRTLMEGKTVIVIAHRLSTIIKMDRIIVIEGGGIRAMGTHAELLEKDDLYKKLWSIQAGGFIQ